MTSTDALERFVTDNPELGRLEQLLSGFNPFEALQIQRQEIRHSAFLSWLFDPNASHGCGDIFLKRFLFSVSTRGASLEIPALRAVDIDTWNLDDTTVRREWHHLDLVLENASPDKRFVVVIENKVLSGEGPGQLARYRERVARLFPGDWRKVFVFLTPEGDPPADEEESAAYVPVSYRDMLAALEVTLAEHASTINEKIAEFVRDYVRMVRRSILVDQEIQELCRKIYARHKQAIDLILEHRPDPQAEIYDFLVNWIREQPRLMLDDSSKAYMRFLPRELDRDELRRGSGWTKTGRMLLFEFRNYAEGLSVNLVIGPGPREIREKLHAAANEDRKLFNHAKRKLGRQWNSVLIRALLSAEDLQDFDSEAVTEKLGATLRSFMEKEMPAVIDRMGSVSV